MDAKRGKQSGKEVVEEEACQVWTAAATMEEEEVVDKGRVSVFRAIYHCCTWLVSNTFIFSLIRFLHSPHPFTSIHFHSAARGLHFVCAFLVRLTEVDVNATSPVTLRTGPPTPSLHTPTNTSLVLSSQIITLIHNINSSHLLTD